MSMKLNHITENCEVPEVKKDQKPFRKRRVSVMQTIYALYIIEAINIIALVVLWVKVFFLHRG